MSYTKIEIESWDKQQVDLIENHDDSSHEQQNCAASVDRNAIKDQNFADVLVELRKY